MPTGTSAPPAAVTRPDAGRALRLAHWSWAMTLLFVVATVVGGAVGIAAPGWLGLPAGGRLAEAGGAGWAVAAGLLAMELAPVTVGGLLAAKAARLDSTCGAATALLVNALLGFYAVTFAIVGMLAR